MVVWKFLSHKYRNYQISGNSTETQSNSLQALILEPTQAFKMDSVFNKIKLTMAIASGLVLSHAVSPVQAVDITPNDDGDTLVNTILGPGITVTPGSLSYTGAPSASGTFTNGLSSGLDFDSGIVLTTGQASDAKGPNSDPATTTVNDFPGDSDLDGLIPGFSTNDATILEFDFTTDGGDLFFNYVFASEEYNEFVDSEFNDVFGFFLDDLNIALIPGTTTPVAINNVNNGDNSSEYNDNESGVFDLEYDGFTNIFTASALDLAPGQHTIKLAIADAGDSWLDSAVFIQAGTFSDTSPKTSVPEPTAVIALLWLGGVGLGKRFWCR
jgi:hypothetical protein